MDAMQTIVMLPTYNEAGNIVPLLEQLLAVAPQLGCLVIDDNSPDGTADCVRQVESRYPGRVELIVRQGRGGRASAGIAGLKAAVARGPAFIAEMDADFSHEPAYLKAFLDAIDDCDVVVGSRFVPGGRDSNRTFFRTQVSRISSQLYRMILGVQVRDVGSGFKLYRREVLESLPWERFLSTGIAISMEELFRIVKSGFRVKEIPIVFTERRAGNSKLRLRDFTEPLKVSLQLVRMLGRA